MPHFTDNSPQKGVTGCGIKTAIRLTRYGLGQRLRDIVSDMDGEMQADALLSWRLELCRCLRDDPHHFLHRPLPDIANAVPASFPQLDAAQSYLNPLVSAFEPSDIPSMRPPDIPLLVHRLEAERVYESENEILTVFRELWPGLAFHAFLAGALASAGSPTSSTSVRFPPLLVYVRSYVPQCLANLVRIEVTSRPSKPHHKKVQIFAGTIDDTIHRALQPRAIAVAPTKKLRRLASSRFFDIPELLIDRAGQLNRGMGRTDSVHASASTAVSVPDIEIIDLTVESEVIDLTDDAA